MALDLAQMRAMINASKNKTTSYDSSSVFSFKKLNVGAQIRIRFIDDGEQNDFFWRTLCTRSLSFDSIRLANGSIVQNKTYVSVPAFNIKTFINGANFQNTNPNANPTTTPTERTIHTLLIFIIVIYLSSLRH